MYLNSVEKVASFFESKWPFLGVPSENIQGVTGYMAPLRSMWFPPADVTMTVESHDKRMTLTFSGLTRGSVGCRKCVELRLYETITRWRGTLCWSPPPLPSLRCRGLWGQHPWRLVFFVFGFGLVFDLFVWCLVWLMHWHVAACPRYKTDGNPMITVPWLRLDGLHAVTWPGCHAPHVWRKLWSWGLLGCYGG